MQPFAPAPAVYSDTVEDDPISLDRAMTGLLEQSPRYPLAPSSPFIIPIDGSPLQSLERSDAPTLLDPVDKSIRFLREFQHINVTRQEVQDLRVRARDERNRMKSTRLRMHQAFSEFGRAIRHGQDTSHQLRSLEEVMGELDLQELSYDTVESNLIPAEYKLKEAEQRLYQDILGDSAIEQSEVDPHTWMTRSSLADMSFTDATMDLLARLPELTPRGRLSALDSAHWDLRVKLESLESNYEALLRDSEMRVAAGVPVDPISQTLISNYVDRRGDLLRQLALNAEARSTLSSKSTVASESTAATDALFQRDQFANVNTDAGLQTVNANDDETVRLSTADFDPRRDDIFPLLTQPVLDSGRAVKISQTPATDREDERPGDVVLATSASDWVLQCVRSSWWSLVRFMFEGYLDESLSFHTIEKYLLQACFSEGDVSVSQAQVPVDVESSRTSQLPDDKVISKSEEGPMHFLDTHVFRNRANTQ